MILGMIVGKDPVNFIQNFSQNISSLLVLPIHDHSYIQPYKIKQDVLKKLNKDTRIQCCLDIEEALEYIKFGYREGKVLICGSLYLVGEILKFDGYKIK